MNLIYIPLDIFRNMPHNEIGELEALAILDRNTVEFMLDDMKKEAEITPKDAEIARLKALLEQRQ